VWENRNEIILEREKKWFRVVFLAKKRYVGYIEEKDGEECHELVARGVELRRTGTITFARDFQVGFYDLMFKPELPTAKVIHEYIKEQHDKFFSCEFKTPEEIELVVKRQKISKNVEEYKAKTPMVELMRRCAAEGKDLRVGDLISYVLVDVGTKNHFAVTYEDYCANTKGLMLKLDHYWNNEIYKPITEQLYYLFPLEDWGQYNSKHKEMRDKKFKAVINRFKKKKFEDKMKTLDIIETYKRFSHSQRRELIEKAKNLYVEEVFQNRIQEIEEKFDRGEILEVI
jgi:hypothetical protein